MFAEITDLPEERYRVVGDVFFPVLIRPFNVPFG